jgi:hypothetical protein
MSEIFVFHDTDTRPHEWRVEEIDSDGDGGIDMAIFSGPHAAASEAVCRAASRRGPAAGRNRECQPSPGMSLTLPASFSGSGVRSSGCGG